jgi:uncharacterized protein (DUF433 family)
MGERPFVRVDPAVAFGQPHIKGVSTEAIAGMWWAGESAETVCDDYHLSRHEFLVALWFEGTHGGFRLQWGGWAEGAYRQLAGWEPLNLGMVLPPDRNGET